MNNCNTINCPTCGNKLDESFVEQKCPRCQKLIESKFICGSCHHCGSTDSDDHNHTAKKPSFLSKLFSIFK